MVGAELGLTLPLPLPLSLSLLLTFNQVPNVAVKGALLPNPPYTLLTTGTLPTDSAGYPPARPGAWSVELPSPFVSAYKAGHLVKHGVPEGSLRPPLAPYPFFHSRHVVFHTGGKGSRARTHNDGDAGCYGCHG